MKLRMDVIDTTGGVDYEELLELCLHFGIDICCLGAYRTADPGFDFQNMVRERGVDILVVPGAVLYTSSKMPVFVSGAVDRVVVPDRISATDMVNMVKTNGGFVIDMQPDLDRPDWNMPSASVVFRSDTIGSWPRYAPCAIACTGLYFSSNLGFALTEIETDRGIAHYEQLSDLAMNRPEAFAPMVLGRRVEL